MTATLCCTVFVNIPYQIIPRILRWLITVVLLLLNKTCVLDAYIPLAPKNDISADVYNTPSSIPLNPEIAASSANLLRIQNVAIIVIEFTACLKHSARG